MRFFLLFMAAFLSALFSGYFVKADENPVLYQFNIRSSSLLDYGIQSIDLRASQVSAELGQDVSFIEDEVNRTHSQPLEEGDLLFNLQIEFSGKPFLVSNQIKKDLDRSLHERVQGASNEDLGKVITESLIEEMNPRYLRLLRDERKNQITHAIEKAVTTAVALARKPVEGVLASIKGKENDQRIDRLRFETALQEVKFIVAKKISDHKTVYATFGKYRFSNAGATTSDTHEMEVEKILVHQPYAISPTDAASTVAAEVGLITEHFLTSQKEESQPQSFTSFSVIVFHGRQAFRSLSDYLGGVVNLGTKDYETHNDLSDINSFLGRLLIQKKDYDFYFSAGFFQNQPALTTGGTLRLKNGDHLFAGYGYSERSEQKAKSESVSHSVYLYYAHALRNSKFPLTLVVGGEYASSAARPAEWPVAREFWRAGVFLSGEDFVKRDFLKKKNISLSTQVGVFWEDSENSDREEASSGIGAGVRGSLQWKSKPKRLFQ